MLEKDIENLITRYPDEFFPKAGFKLKGRQVALGPYYADLIFTDKYDRVVVIEIKRGTLSRDAAGQIFDYYGFVKRENPQETVELILCANVIPPERVAYLEKAGIECKQISEARINEIATKYGYEFLDAEKKDGLTGGIVNITAVEVPPKENIEKNIRETKELIGGHTIITHAEVNSSEITKREEAVYQLRKQGYCDFVGLCGTYRLTVEEIKNSLEESLKFESREQRGRTLRDYWREKAKSLGLVKAKKEQRLAQIAEKYGLAERLINEEMLKNCRLKKENWREYGRPN